MEFSPIKKQAFVIVILGSLMILLVKILPNVLFLKTKIVYCDVGQGDAAYIRIKNRFDIVIDAGPDKSVLTCLGNYMPFYDHTIELAFISHPQKDHFYGFTYILDRYRVEQFVVSPITAPTVSFQRLLSKIKEKHIPMSVPHEKSVFYIYNNTIRFYWPTSQFVKNYTTATTDVLLKRTRRDPNDFSLIFTLEENRFRALFTGDASPFVLQGLLNQPNLKSNILKIPHHGSRNGLTADFFRLADPSVSVISVGKKNKYGHPSKEVIDLLEASYKKYYRTDRDGNVVFTVPN